MRVGGPGIFSSVGRGGFAGRMRIKRVDPADAARSVPVSRRTCQPSRRTNPTGLAHRRPFRGWLTVGWGGDPCEIWLAAGQRTGTVAGWYRLELPDLENLDQAYLDLVVHPASGGTDSGRALLTHAAARAAEHGRSALSGPTTWGRRRGLRPRYRGGVRSGGRAAGDGRARYGRRSAGPAPRGGRARRPRSIRWCPGPGWCPRSSSSRPRRSTPRSTTSRMTRGLARVWDAQRVRERVNNLRPAYGSADLRGGGATEATGELAALTQVAVDPPIPAG